MRICFVVADVRAQQATFSGIYLALAAHRRGHEVRFVSVDDLSFLDDNNILATTTRVRAGDYADHGAYARALGSEEAVVEEDTLGSFDVVFLRYNPIREGEGRPGAPLIDFGWRLRLAGTLVVNDPEGLRRAGSRMYLSDFPADVRTRTLVSRSKTRLKAFLKELDGPAVLEAAGPPRRRARLLPAAAAGLEPQPDDRRRHQGRLRGGAGVPARGRAGGKAALAAERGAAAGGRPGRHLPAAGRSRGARKRRPERRPRSRRRRTAAGGPAATRAKCDFGPVEARICDILRPRLLADGLTFVAVDIVGDRILELNVFTPGGLHPIHELYGIDAADIVIADLERRVRLRAAYRTTFDPEAADVV